METEINKAFKQFQQLISQFTIFTVVKQIIQVQNMTNKMFVIFSQHTMRGDKEKNDDGDAVETWTDTKGLAVIHNPKLPYSFNWEGYVIYAKYVNL